MKVTRIAQSKNLNNGKYQALQEQAQRLGNIRSDVWQRCGSVRSIGLSDRKIRDNWLKEKRVFPVLANAWKETLRDAKANIDMTIEPTGMLRLTLKDGIVEVHYAIEVAETHNCGTQTVGIDKGYTEVLVDSDAEHHGIGFGKLLKAESDTLKIKNQRRAKLRAIAKNTHNERKRQNILKHNLGNKKRRRRSNRIKSQISDIIYKAVHAVVNKAAVIAAEDLTAPMSGKKFNKDVNRRLASWTKGVIAKALENVSRRRGSTVVLINPAYTSQIDSRNGGLIGRRHGEQFHCFDGVVLQADENAARNVLARLSDPEIDRWLPFKKVKAILLKRTERLRLELLNQDSSCKPQGLSTESELVILDI